MNSSVLRGTPQFVMNDPLTVDAGLFTIRLLLSGMQGMVVFCRHCLLLGRYRGPDKNLYAVRVAVKGFFAPVPRPSSSVFWPGDIWEQSSYVLANDGRKRTSYF